MLPGPAVSNRPTLYLIDGSAYVYRAFFALPALNNSKGLQTNAVYGFTTTLMKIIREHQPQGLAVVFDEGGPTLRHETYQDYKAQRPPMPEGMSAQIPYIHRVVEALNIPVVRQAGYEADDLIARYAKEGLEQGLEVVIVSSDKDLAQLVCGSADERCAIRLWDTMKNRRIGPEEVREQWGVGPELLGDLLALAGDVAACRELVSGMARLSPERVAHELLRLLQAPQPIPAARLMQETGVLAQVLLEQLLPLGRQLVQVVDPARGVHEPLRHTVPGGHATAPFSSSRTPKNTDQTVMRM